MEAIRKRLKPIAFLLTALLLLQSCVVYHKTPTTLEKASQERIKTKVINANGEIAKYKYIAFEDGQFYGVSKKSGNLVRTSLNEQVIVKITTKNKTASTLVTIGVIAIPTAALVFLLGAISWANSDITLTY